MSMSDKNKSKDNCMMKNGRYHISADKIGFMES